MRAASLAVLIALGAAACTGGLSDDPAVGADPDSPRSLTPSPDDETATGDGSDSDDGATPSPDPGDAPEGESGSAGEGNAGEGNAGPPESTERIVVQTADGTLFTVRPDGEDRVDLAADGRLHSQPVWSPDAGRLAWTAVDPASGATTVASARYDGTAWAEVTAPGAPFYLSWDPTSSRVATLGPAAAGLDVGIVDVAASEPWRRIDRGEPYWFVWGPDGTELLVHADSLRLDRVGLDGTTLIVADAPAPFLTPEWTFDARALLYPTDLDGEPTLVSSGVEGEGVLPLFTYDGLLRFSVSPDINRIAVRTEEIPESDDGVVTASAPLPRTSQVDPDDLPHLDVGTFAMVATFGSEPLVLSEEEIVAFWWAPGGAGLAWLEVEPGAPEDMVRWWFLTTDGLVEGPLVEPSAVWARDHLPFFDQYSRSHAIWSPDGTRITFAGTVADGRTGVFVHETVRGAEPTRISEGVVAVWSPAPAGGGATSPL